MDDQALRDHFHFDEADLNANRYGRLSERQQQNLFEQYNSGKRFGFLGGLGCGVFFFAVASIFPIAVTPHALAALQKGNTGEAVGTFIGIGVWVLIWGGIGCYGFWSAISSVSKQKPVVSLKSVVGSINLVGVERSTSSGTGMQRTTRTYIQHELHVGQQTFDVDEELGGYLMQGDTYAVYFVNEDEIMSLERLAKA